MADKRSGDDPMNNHGRRRLTEQDIVTKAAERARKRFWLKVVIFTLLVVAFLAWRWWSR